MGKASSAKKVARAARAGGGSKRRSGQRRAYAFPAVIALIVVVGVSGVVVARNNNESAIDTDSPPAVGDHWHDAYGVYLCDHWADPLSDRGPDRLGIHTHEDGLVHIHPGPAGAGDNATLGKFFDQVGLSVSSDEIRLPNDDVYREDETTCGGEPAEVRVLYWQDAQTAGQAAQQGNRPNPTERIDSDIGDVRFDRNGGAYTFAFVAEGTEVPVPQAAANIAALGAVDGGQPPAGGQVPGGQPVPVQPGGGQPQQPPQPEDPASGGG